MPTIAPRTTDPATLRRLYRDLVRVRMVDERIAELYPEQQMRCPVHLSIGQEAVSAGVCARLERQDWVMSGHRSHGHFLAKGGSLPSMLAEMYGRATGCTGGKGGSMHLIDLEAGFLGAVPIVGSTIPMAVGAAWGARSRGESRVVVSFFGEAATEEGVFHEAVNFACLKKLPVIFVCENNLFSVYTPLDVRQPGNREVADVARGHGIESVQADGNDTVGVYDLAGWAVDRARAGQGPTFLEFKTYRWREHCGPYYDNDIGYRTEAEYLAWREKCPVERFERDLLASGVVDAQGMTEIRAAITRELDEAVAFAKASPFPPDHEMATFTYAE